MRLAGQAKLGYYPIPPIVVAELVKHLQLRPPVEGKLFNTCCILDPCAGEGAAIKQIADSIGVEDKHVHAIELDPGRSATIKSRIPEARVLGNTSFLGTECTGSSFGLAYLNPPFDDELGGGRREEQAFVQAATPLLVTHGVLALVCPITALAGNSSFCTFIDASYENITVYKFPDREDPVTRRPTRLYKEIVVLGQRRKEILPKDDACRIGTLHSMEFGWRNMYPIGELPSLENVFHVYQIPHSRTPNTFRKCCFTCEELDAAAANSPLNKLFDEQPTAKIGQPPLALSRGHIGLELASGHPVSGPYGTHIVRGGSYKKTVLDPTETISTVNPESGAITTKETYRERMVTVIRCLVDYPFPQIVTLSNDEDGEKDGQAQENSV